MFSENNSQFKVGCWIENQSTILPIMIASFGSYLIKNMSFAVVQMDHPILFACSAPVTLREC